MAGCVFPAGDLPGYLPGLQMKVQEGDGSSTHGAGLSIGAGLQLQKLKLNVAYAKYHVSASSILINISYAL